MSMNQIDDVSALIVIDLQKGLAGMPTVHPVGEIAGRTARLARAFRARGLPVVLVNVSGMAPGRTEAARPKFSFPADWTDLMPELEQQEGDILITKQRWGAFDGTELHDALRRLGVTQVVMTGVATSIGVESTARCAYDLGYNVALVTDAMTDRDAEAHRYSIEKIFPRLGETATTDEVIKLLRHED
jgi:nicotinamidase-related amidase